MLRCTNVHSYNITCCKVPLFYAQQTCTRSSQSYVALLRALFTKPIASANLIPVALTSLAIHSVTGWIMFCKVASTVNLFYVRSRLPLGLSWADDQSGNPPYACRAHQTRRQVAERPSPTASPQPVRTVTRCTQALQERNQRRACYR